jgi:hypothetical protein
VHQRSLWFSSLIDFQLNLPKALPFGCLPATSSQEEAAMLGKSVSGTATLAVTSLLAIAMASPAAARIECRGNFQVTKYGLISTPYCEEEQIARVARSYGARVTGAEVRNNALTKVYLCQVYGSDIRLKGSCAGYAPELYGRH